MTEFSAPVAKRPFSADQWRYVIGNEPGIKEDNDGTAYDLTFSTGSDEALVGSLTQPSVTVVGGAVHWVPTAQRHPVTIPPATSAPRTDLIVVRNNPAWGTLPTDEAAAAAWVGPCRLYRIPGTEGSDTAPAYDGDPAGIEDEVLWEVTRRPNESLAQATKRDRRIRTGPNLSAPSLPDLPRTAPLGSRGVAAGREYVRALDAQGAADWVEATPPTPTPLAIPLVDGYTNLAGHGAPTFTIATDGTVTLSGGILRSAATATTAQFAVGTLPDAARPTVARTFLVATASGPARLSVATTGVLTVIYPAPVQITQGFWFVAFDGSRFRLREV